MEIHKEHNMYVPELIFGELLTSSNYDDDEKKVVGGRNGYGAKLANVYSRVFRITCGDIQNSRVLEKEWHNNMSECTPP